MYLLYRMHETPMLLLRPPLTVQLEEDNQLVAPIRRFLLKQPYTSLPWQQDGYQWGIFTIIIHVIISNGFMDIRRLYEYMHERLIGRPITMDNGMLNSYNGYKRIIMNSALSASALPQPRIIFRRPSSSLGYNYYKYILPCS